MEVTMFDRKSDAALNKNDPDAIVCRSVKGVHIRLTREDFSCQAEFEKWKKWSDEDYYQREHTSGGKDTQCYSLDEERDSHGSLSLEDIVMAHLLPESRQILMDKRHGEVQEQIQRLKQLLTKTQFRRLWMFLVDGLPIKEIAAREQVSTQRVSRCLIQAHKRIVNKL